ncbi:MAG: hypothetical protein IAE93_15980 [Ignavibacteria bacterium]|nr:hypothetical protein [Ignavibacteria bacterium]
MYKQVLQSISGIEIYPEIALIIFFAFFLGVIVWSFTRSKKYISTMEKIPLDDSSSEKSSNLNAGGVK